MRILSVRVGFVPDHSTTTYRYTAPDKATAWRAFWDGLPAVCAAGQVQNLTLFSPEPLPELNLWPFIKNLNAAWPDGGIAQLTHWVN